MSFNLEALSDSYANAVEAASESVVRVEARRRLPASGILWREAGFVLSANHAVQRDDQILIGLPSGDASDAELVGRDPSLDLALLKLKSDHSSDRWKATEDVRVGHLVFALGRPGSKVMATHGIVSALGSGWRKSKSAENQLLQTDVVMYPGFSGGALIDSQGSILGMNTSGLRRGTSMAVPQDLLVSRIQALLEFGYIRRGYLGVSLQPVRLSSTLQDLLKQETGLLVAGVEEGGPADTARIFQGDVLVGIGESSLLFPDDLLHQLERDRVGQEIELQIVRGGELLKITVRVGERS